MQRRLPPNCIQIVTMSSLEASQLGPRSTAQVPVPGAMQTLKLVCRYSVSPPCAPVGEGQCSAAALSCTSHPQTCLQPQNTGYPLHIEHNCNAFLAVVSRKMSKSLTHLS